MIRVRVRTMRWIAVASVTLATAGSAFAVVPLVTDDADPVERGHVQVNVGWQFARAGSMNAHTVPVNPVLGVSDCGEVGATVGYLRLDASGDDGLDRRSRGTGRTLMATAFIGPVGVGWSVAGR